jgi:O-antigen ligase
MIPASLSITFLSTLFYIWYKENGEIILASFGKDPGLSGRTEIWSLIYEVGLKSPWVGYGYQAFWRGFDGPSAEVWYAVDWYPPHSHNGFLDLWLSLGSLGLIIFMLSFLSNLLKGFYWLRYLSKTPDGFWPLLFMIFLILSNLTETGLMKENDIYTLIYMTISYSLTIVTLKNSRTLDQNTTYAEELI